MKARKYILGVALIGLIGSGCTNTWDEHYAQNASTVNNTEISIVNESLTDYLAQESSLSNMYQLFNETGMVDQLLAKEQMYTILAVESSIAVGDDPIYTAQTYISYFFRFQTGHQLLYKICIGIFSVFYIYHRIYSYSYVISMLLKFFGCRYSFFQRSSHKFIFSYNLFRTKSK